MSAGSAETASWLVWRDLAELFVHTTYSMSSVYGFRKAYACVRIHTHSLFFARNRYITENIWPFCFITCSKFSFMCAMSSGWKKS